MSNGKKSWKPASPRPTKVRPEGWDLEFYGGFVRSVSVRENGSQDERELFQQRKAGPFPFNLPRPAEAPEPRSEIRIRRPGDPEPGVTLTVDDPQHLIAEIHVRYKSPEEKAKEARLMERWAAGEKIPPPPEGGVQAFQAAEGGTGGEGETVVIRETVIMCPPYCG